MAAKRARRGRGEGGIRYDSQKKLWVGSVSLGYHPDGRRNRPVVYGSSKQEVMDGIAKIRGERGTADAGRMTVGELLTRWLANDSGLSVTTVENRALSVRLHVEPRIGSVRLAKLTTLQVQDFYTRMRKGEGKVGAATAQVAAQSLVAALNFAVSLKLLASSPADGVSLPARDKREMCFLTASQSKLLLAAAAGRWLLPLLSAALGTGCRQGELLGLAWPDLNLDIGTLTVRRSLAWTRASGFVLKEPKTRSSRRTVSLPAFVIQALVVYRAAQLKAGLISKAVFCAPSGRYRRRADVRDALQRIITKANKKSEAIPPLLRFHDLRHTMASLLLSGGQSLKAVSQRLGHTDPALTLRTYAHCLPNDDTALSVGLDAMFG